MMAIAERRRRRLNNNNGGGGGGGNRDVRNAAHQYMRSLRGERTNTLFIAYTINHGTVDPHTPQVFNNPSTVVFTFNGTVIAEHFTEYFHFQKATLPHIDPAVIRRVTKWIMEDFRDHRNLLPDYIIILRDHVMDDMQATVENIEFEAFKEALAEYAKESDLEWIPRYAFGMAPWRPENTEPLVYLYQNDHNIFETNDEFQQMIVSMFIPININNFRFSVLEPFWAAEHTAKLWTTLFPTYAAFTASQNRPLPRLVNSNQYDFDTISLQFHLDPVDDEDLPQPLQ